MKRSIIALCVLMIMGTAHAATLLTVKIHLKDTAVKCGYMFFTENGKIKYQPDPISPRHCNRTLDMSKSIKSVDVRIPVKDVMIDGKATTCLLQVNKRSENSPYVYSYYASNRQCDSVIDVKLDQ